jgi:hypothetical protein
MFDSDGLDADLAVASAPHRGLVGLLDDRFAATAAPPGSRTGRLPGGGAAGGG